MKIDLHVHCSERSLCARSGEAQIINAAAEFGIDAIGITDHNKFVPQGRLDKLNQKYAPVRIFGGIEIAVEKEHILVYGVRHRTLEQKGWKYSDLYEFVKERDGLMILAHPFRLRKNINIDIDTFPPDAMELHSLNTYLEDEDHIRTAAQKNDIALLHSSDSHWDQHVGIFHIKLENSVESEQELIYAIKNRSFTLRADKKRLERFRRTISEVEIAGREIIESGGGALEFYERTGYPDIFFRRLMRGKSLMV